jgi:hypothetical protein
MWPEYASFAKIDCKGPSQEIRLYAVRRWVKGDTGEKVIKTLSEIYPSFFIMNNQMNFSNFKRFVNFKEIQEEYANKILFRNPNINLMNKSGLKLRKVAEKIYVLD